MHNFIDDTTLSKIIPKGFDSDTQRDLSGRILITWTLTGRKPKNGTGFI